LRTSPPLQGDNVSVLYVTDRVDVPAEHLESGMAPPLPPMRAAAAQIRIRRSAGRPSNAMVAVEHHGWWYSIDSTDGQSKAGTHGSRVTVDNVPYKLMSPL